VRHRVETSYNVLQKLAYLGVIVVLAPIVVLTGLTMSPAIDAAVPWLPDMFGGRQSARTLHFAGTVLFVIFVIVHVAMVLLTGVMNNLRSMITGWYGADKAA
jgi:thiosulfate reductase cytochrome b subunit